MLMLDWMINMEQIFLQVIKLMDIHFILGRTIGTGNIREQVKKRELHLVIILILF